MDDVFCNGNETEISHCRFAGWGNNDCEASEAAGVICVTAESEESAKLSETKIRRKHKFGKKYDMDIRLAGGRNENEGQVEVSVGVKVTSGSVHCLIILFICFCTGTIQPSIEKRTLGCDLRRRMVFAGSKCRVQITGTRLCQPRTADGHLQ